MIKGLFKVGLRLAEAMAYFSGAYLILRQFDKHRVRILMYHRIRSSSDGFLPFETGLYVSPDTFAKQMVHLKRRYQVMGLAEYLKARKERRSLPPHTVILTFDDGFHDNFKNAYPVLKRLGLPATFFVVGSTMQGELIWLHRYYRLRDLLTTDRLLTLFRKAHPMLDPVSTERELLRRIKYGLTKKEREEVLRKIFKKEGGASTQGIYCSAEELNSMDGIVEIGSHTLNHHVMDSLSVKEVADEIVEAKRILQKSTGQDIDTFAYPFGNKETYNEKVKAVLRKHHQGAVTTEERIAAEGDDPFELPRLSVVEGPMFSFAATLIGIRASLISILRLFTR